MIAGVKTTIYKNALNLATAAPRVNIPISAGVQIIPE